MLVESRMFWKIRILYKNTKFGSLVSKMYSMQCCYLCLDVWSLQRSLMRSHSILVLCAVGLNSWFTAPVLEDVLHLWLKHFDITWCNFFRWEEINMFYLHGQVVCFCWTYNRNFLLMKWENATSEWMISFKNQHKIEKASVCLEKNKLMVER